MLLLCGGLVGRIRVYVWLHLRLYIACDEGQSAHATRECDHMMYTYSVLVPCIRMMFDVLVRCPRTVYLCIVAFMVRTVVAYICVASQ